MDAAARTVALRLRAQGLTGPRCAGIDALLQRLVGVQAQDLAFARLALRPRCSAAVAASDVDDAARRGEVVWTWAMRGTLHLVRASDAGWLVGLLGPIFAARGRPRRLALGLDDALCERALGALRGALADGRPQTRAALAACVGIDGSGQTPAHLMRYAALRGVLRRVPGREPTFALLEQTVEEHDEDEALARLAQRYLAGHGPAAAEDLAAWAGIGLRRARRAIAQAGPRSLADGGDVALASLLAPVRAPARPHVALLGIFDPYLLGYASRDLVLDRRFAQRIQAGGGFIAPAILVDGRVAGTWRRDRLEFFEPATDDVRAAAERELADVERYLAAP
jgi:hypothetical protein